MGSSLGHHLRLFVCFLVALVAPAAGQGPPADEEDERPPELRLRLLAPFSPPRNSSFFSGLGLPSLRHARVQPEGVLTARLRGSETHTADTADRDGHRSRLDAVYIEQARLDLELVVHDRVALFADSRIAGWDERRDVFRIADERGALVIEGEAVKATSGRATSRHENLAVVSFGALVTALRSDDGSSALGASITFKLPGFRRGDGPAAGVEHQAIADPQAAVDRERDVAGPGVRDVAPFGQPWIFEDADRFDAHAFLQSSTGRRSRSRAARGCCWAASPSRSAAASDSHRGAPTGWPGSRLAT